jgi:putative tryptophan/tyrosine transport system substrate-binding protein
MKRREFAGIVAGIAAWPLLAHAENTDRVRRVGVLLGNTEGDPQLVAGMSAFRQAMQELGWAEGRNLQIDLRWGRADPERMQMLALQLVEQRPDILFASTTPVIAALHSATKSIPTVFVLVSDPVGSGLVATLSRPGGNITGFINIEASLGGKWAEVLKELAPGLSHAAILFNPKTAPYYAYYVKPFEDAARSFQIEPLISPVHSGDEIKGAITALAAKPRPGLVMPPDTFTPRARAISSFR